MEQLPELPFEQVLSNLNFEDRLKARTVSRAWRNKFDSYPLQSLCYSQRPSDFIFEKIRWVSGAFAKNFISTNLFAPFFDTFGQTILSNLKHLRFCELYPCGYEAAFTRTLNSFGKLEELDIIRAKLNQQDTLFNLNLPMLTSFQLEKVDGIEKLTLKAPRLRVVKILDCSDLSLDLVHGELVERLLVDWLGYTEVKKLKNLQFLYAYQLSRADSTFLSSLQQLKEIHTNDFGNVWELFEQKQQSGRADLKVYLYGMLLNGRDDPTWDSPLYSTFDYMTGESLACLVENQSRLADEIPFYCSLLYSAIEGVAPALEVELLKRFTDLYELQVNRSVQNVQRFLDLLKNFENIVLLQFLSDQPQDLFDRLPEHSVVQVLLIKHPPSDLAFLFRLKHLIDLNVHWTIDSETVRRAFEKLPALSLFRFRYDQKEASIEIDQRKQFQVSVGDEKTIVFSDLNAAIESIFGNERPKKRKAEDLE